MAQLPCIGLYKPCINLLGTFDHVDHGVALSRPCKIIKMIQSGKLRSFLVGDPAHGGPQSLLVVSLEYLWD